MPAQCRATQENQLREFDRNPPDGRRSRDLQKTVLANLPSYYAPSPETGPPGRPGHPAGGAIVPSCRILAQPRRAHDQDRSHHRRHRPGRCLPGRIAAAKGLPGPWHQAPFVAVQHRPCRPPLSRPARRPPALHAALRRPHGQHQPDPHRAAGAARRGLQPGCDEPRRRELRAARVHGRRRRHRHAAAAGGDPHPRTRRQDALLSGVHLRAVRSGAGSAAEGDHAVLPTQPVRGGQVVRLLDHRQLPRGLRHVRLQRRAVQPREPAARRDLRHAQDHPRHRASRSGCRTACTSAT
jgi:hypothetical protein